MSAYVVVLRSQKLISVKARWVQNPIINEESVVFYSPNDGEHPNFTSEPLYFFKYDMTACYQSRVVKKFGNHGSSSYYIILILIAFFSLAKSVLNLTCLIRFDCSICRFCWSWWWIHQHAAPPHSVRYGHQHSCWTAWNCRIPWMFQRKWRWMFRWWKCSQRNRNGKIYFITKKLFLYIS